MKKALILTTSLAFLFAGQNLAFASVPNIGPAQLKLPIVNSDEKSKYHRIVALADGSAEIVAALGYKNDLVGRDIASTMPELASIPIDTNAHQVATEKVLAQRPDLIIIDANTSPASAIDTLKKSGIKVVKIPNSFTMGEIPIKELAVANVLGTPKAAKLLASNLTAQKFAPSRLTVAFLYLRGTASIYLVGGKGSGTDSILSAIGVTDIGAKNLSTPFTSLTAEALVKMQPDVLLLMTKGLDSVGGISGLTTLPGIAQTPAGRNKRVVTVDDSLLLSFGPRTSAMLPILRANIDKVAKQ